MSFVSKLTDKIVLDQLLCHLDQNNLWHTFQPAYRPKHSTEKVLLRVFNDLLTASDFGSIYILTLLNLSGAFDTIDSKTLLVFVILLYPSSVLTCKVGHK